MLDRRNHIPLYIQLKDELVAKIKEGTWDVDFQIPTERALMEEYGIGRATVREAISHLEKEGYLYIKHGVGTFVARKQPSLGFEPLISLTYSLKARGIEARNVVMENKPIVTDSSLHSKTKWKKGETCYYVKRIRYVDSKPIAIEDSYFEGRFACIGEKYDLTESLAKLILEDLKVTISRVDQTVIPRHPSKEEQNELGIDGNAMILNLERWIYVEEENRPFYYLKFIIPSDIYTFAI